MNWKSTHGISNITIETDEDPIYVVDSDEENDKKNKVILIDSDDDEYDDKANIHKYMMNYAQQHGYRLYKLN